MAMTWNNGTLDMQLYNKAKMYTRVVWKHIGINHPISGSRGGVNKKMSTGVVISHRDSTLGGYWLRSSQCGASTKKLARLNTSV